MKTDTNDSGRDFSDGDNIRVKGWQPRRTARHHEQKCFFFVRVVSSLIKKRRFDIF